MFEDVLYIQDTHLCYPTRVIFYLLITYVNGLKLHYRMYDLLDTFIMHFLLFTETNTVSKNVSSSLTPHA